jgi:hypothetical protein
MLKVDGVLPNNATPLATSGAVACGNALSAARSQPASASKEEKVSPFKAHFPQPG